MYYAIITVVMGKFIAHKIAIQMHIIDFCIPRHPDRPIWLAFDLSLVFYNNCVRADDFRMNIFFIPA